MAREKVLLHTAYWWECPTCGARNYGDPAPAELTDEDKDELRDGHGIDEAETGDFVAMPNEVRCETCDEWWDTQDESELN